MMGLFGVEAQVAGAFAGHSYVMTRTVTAEAMGRHSWKPPICDLARAPDRYGENWRGNSNSGFHSFGRGYDRTPRQAYNHMQAPESRQQFDRRGYGSSLNRGTGEGYRGEPGSAHDRSMQAYRAPTPQCFTAKRIRGPSSAFASRMQDFMPGKPPHRGGRPAAMVARSALGSFASSYSGGFHMGVCEGMQSAALTARKKFRRGHFTLWRRSSLQLSRRRF